MTAKSMLWRPQGLRPKARAPICPAPCYATDQGFLKTFQIALIGWIKAGPSKKTL